MCAGEDLNITCSVPVFGFFVRPIGLHKNSKRFQVRITLANRKLCLLHTNVHFIHIVRRRGLEPPRPCGHIHLKDACLPVSTPAQLLLLNINSLFLKWAKRLLYQPSFVGRQACLPTKAGLRNILIIHFSLSFTI